MRSLFVSVTVCFVVSASSSALAESSAPAVSSSAAVPATPISPTAPVAPSSTIPPAQSSAAAAAPSATQPSAAQPSAPLASAPQPSAPQPIKELRPSQSPRYVLPRARDAEPDPEIPEGSSYRPPVVVAYEGGRVPKDAKLEERPRTGLIATGISLTASAYAASLTYAIATCGAQMECRNGSAWLYAPIIGPFVAATRAPTSGGMALAAFDGAVQSIGVALFAAGFLAPKTMVVTYRDTAIRVAPVSVGSAMGVGVLVQSL